jgi:hypothetical protein
MTPSNGSGSREATSTRQRYDNPVIARFVEHVRETNAGAMSAPGVLEPVERARLYRAAHRARSRYPGPVGELIQREIEAFLGFGYRFTSGALFARLANHVLADETSRESHVPPDSGPAPHTTS